jgi:hypothetical protein
MKVPVRVRIGEGREWTIGSLPATDGGRVNPNEAGRLFITLGQYMLEIADREALQEEDI